MCYMVASLWWARARWQHDIEQTYSSEAARGNRGQTSHRVHGTTTAFRHGIDLIAQGENSNCMPPDPVLQAEMGPDPPVAAGPLPGLEAGRVIGRRREDLVRADAQKTRHDVGLPTAIGRPPALLWRPVAEEP